MKVDYYDLAERAVHRIEEEIGIGVKNLLNEELIGSVYEEFLKYEKTRQEEELKELNVLTIEDFHVGDKVKFVRLVGDEESFIDIGSMGEITDINSKYDYPITCKIGGLDDYAFLPSELEIANKYIK